MKSKIIDSFFKKKSTETTQSPSEASQIEVPSSSVEDEALDLSNLEREPGLCKQIYKYPLEYAPSKDAVFCLPCFLFNSNPSSLFRSTTFAHSGFSNWKKVHDGCNCAFLTHMGKDLNSHHNNAQRAYVDLMNKAQHIEVSLDRQTTQQIAANRLRLRTSIDVVRWLSFQGCAFRGHDESSGSKNRETFLELLSLLASYDEKVEDILESALQNASYTSSTIQKEMLQIYASRVRNVISEEISDRKFRIIVDEARDDFFDIVHVKDTASLTLKNVIFNVLLQHSFDIQNIRGQGYDGASNMCGDFNSLQALILNDYRYAYYVHCFAHRLQLALVAAVREVVEVNQFFKDLPDIIGTLQPPGETRRNVKMYNATSTVLENLKNIASNYSQQGDAHHAYNRLRYFKFIFILHMMKEVLGITDNLCQALQCHSQDILNAMSLVLTTKYLIQKLRDDGWNKLLKNVISFCETWELNFPYMNAQYIVGHSRNKKEDVTVEHHYQVDIFFATIDTQLQELKSRFNEHVVELLTLTTTLYLKEFFKLFDIDKICILLNKLYPGDSSQQEKERLSYELKHYELDVCKHPNLRKISTLSELCRSLVESGKSIMYPLVDRFVDRLIRLILTLLVSTASSERAFSAMKIVKSRLCNKMKDEFLRSSLVVYIEKVIAEKFDINEIIDDFSEVKDRRVQFK
ncbi:hypothetical protein ES332_D04G122600v1 [Gossypium tomentosum]|uniref:TTF-type domain-containing protein n=1 Tax=Gossypium tomentosum TaxID=34277 RepID=A0A5D2LCM8_GOSTO|nr:hypothetical protein ES332_D04G122600v1 [Gossypium tomentosum]